MKVLVLEDDWERIKQFTDWRMQGHEVTITKTVGEAISELEQNEFDLLCLDHDLGEHVYVESIGAEETGYLVALWLSQNPERSPDTIVLHSLNRPGRDNMKSALPRAQTFPFVWMHTLEELFNLEKFRGKE